MQAYDREFFAALDQGCLHSAMAVVPLVLELVPVRSVVDVGCGNGAWLQVFHQHGIDDMLGIDFHVHDSALRIPRDRFVRADLRYPLRLNQRFDLALSLEVAEHLPPAAADTFADSLTRMAPVVLFSAAIPQQGGLNHVNEQWPDYWVKRFQQRGFLAIDCLRARIWENPAVEWWYAQNLLLFVHGDYLASYPGLQAERECPQGSPLRLVHPGNYLKPPPLGVLPFRALLRALPIAFVNSLKRRVRPQK